MRNIWSHRKKTARGYDFFEGSNLHFSMAQLLGRILYIFYVHYDEMFLVTNESTFLFSLLNFDPMCIYLSPGIRDAPEVQSTA